MLVIKTPVSWAQCCSNRNYSQKSCHFHLKLTGRIDFLMPCILPIHMKLITQHWKGWWFSFKFICPLLDFLHLLDFLIEPKNLWTMVKHLTNVQFLLMQLSCLLTQNVVVRWLQCKIRHRICLQSAFQGTCKTGKWYPIYLTYLQCWCTWCCYCTIWRFTRMAFVLFNRRKNMVCLSI